MATPLDPLRITLPNSVHVLPPGATALRKTNPNQRIELTLGVRRMQQVPDLSALDNLRPKQRTYLTHEKLAGVYGSDPAAVDRIKAFAQKYQLTVTRDQRASARIGLAGTVANASKAFGVQLMDYEQTALGKFHARTGQISIPAELSSDITGVFGFNNHRVMRRQPHLPDAKRVTRTQTARPWFIPTELASVYNFPPADLSGQCVAVLEFGGGVEESDLSSYCKKIGVPTTAVQVIPLDGVATDPSADPDSTGEVMLDIEIVGALATGAKVAAYFSTFDEKGVIDALSAVIGDTANNPSVVSISWGWDENQPFSNGVLWSPTAIEHVNESLLSSAQLGITVCVSTGDDGSEAQVKDGRAHVNFPATSPYVLAVGGTTLHVTKDADGKAQVQEVVWNDGPGSGTGGGVSDITPVPTWQQGIVPSSINPGNFAGRAIPDVAANADPATGYLTMSGGKLGIVGGTSASAPLWASLIVHMNALIGARTGNFNALLYSTFGPQGVLRDITTGNNDTDGLLDGQFAAKAGWDACTGWGTPDGAKLLAALNG